MKYYIKGRSSKSQWKEVTKEKAQSYAIHLIEASGLIPERIPANLEQHYKNLIKRLVKGIDAETLIRVKE